MPKQYCRYCGFCLSGDVYYCSAYDKLLRENTIKRANKCRNFVLSDLGDVDTGKKYKPQNKQTESPCNYEQLSLL